MNDNPDASIEREREIFLAALEKTSPTERDAFLDRACGNDAALRARVESLLRHHSADSFLEEPAIGAEALPSPESAVCEGVGTVIGRYKLLQKIGEGGMGVVYMAEQEEPVRRKVALKVIKVGMDTKQVVARFEAERQALALMDHPNIARVLDGGATDAGRPFFVMELVQGVPVTEFCDKNQLSVEDRVKLFIPVCQAIQSAHQKGIIHRDLKPTNILVTLNAGAPHPMVIDFGVAKATNQKLTEKTLFTNYATMIGTPAYMSPEQAEMSRLDVDTRTDIYGLGVLLYELLTGTTPFPEKRLRSASYQEMQRIIMEEEPERPSTRLRRASITASRPSPPLSTLNSALSTDLDWIVMKCLEKERARRYETANGLAADLQRYLNSEPVTASPPDNLYRFRKLVQRNKTVCVAIAAVAAALVLGIIGSASEALRARRAEQQQTRLRADAETARQQAQTQANRAVAATAETRRMLVDSDFADANRFVDSGDAADAVPYLSRILSAEPDNGAALAQLAILLTYHTWMAPILQLGKEATMAQFSPDGSRIVVTFRDNFARVLDAQTGRPLSAPMRHQGLVFLATFGPDGCRVVTASSDGTARVWDAQTGQPLTGPLRHAAALDGAVFSPDGKRVLTCADDNTARVWDAGSGQLLAEMKHAEHILSAQFSPDGKRVVTASRDWTARVWDSQTGLALTGPLRHQNWVVHAEFSPDGQHVVTSSCDATAQVWDAQTGLPAGAPMLHSVTVTFAKFSRDGRRVVTTSHDKTARLWDAQTGRPLTEPLRHLAPVWDAEFSPDGSLLVTASADKSAKVWDAHTGQLLAELKQDGEAILPQFSPDARRILISGTDGVRIWGAPIPRALPQSLGQGIRAQFSADGSRVAVATYDAARVWDLAAGQPVGEPMTHTNLAIFDSHGNLAVYDAQFSPDGQRLGTASGDGAARVWDARTGQPLTPWLKHGNRVYSIRFSPDGKRVVTASWDKTARIWDAATGQALAAPLPHDDYLSCAEFSPDGQRILTASWDHTARVWDTQTGRPLGSPMRHQREVNNACFSPDGKRVATGSADMTARVWDAETGQPISPPLPHAAFVSSVQFSPDSRRLLTASRDNTARVWDAQTGQPLTPPLEHPALINCAFFSPDGRRIVTTLSATDSDWLSAAQFSADGQWVLSASSAIRLWDAESGRPISELFEDTAEIGADAAAIAKERGDLPRSDAVRLWDAGFVPSSLPDWLLPAAEALSGKRLNQQGALVQTDMDRAKTLAQIHAKLHQLPTAGNGVAWGRWLLSDPANRTISPISTMTLYPYIDAQIKVQTAAAENAFQLLSGGGDLSQRITGLGEWLPLAYANPELFQRVLNARDQLEQTSFLCTNGVARARAGQWTNAVDDFSKLCQLYPTEAWYHHFLAVLQVQLGDVEGYSRHRARMLATYGATNGFGPADLIGKACLILPLTGTELDTAARLADTAVTKGAGSENHAWFELCKGLAEYRQGHFAGAVDWMQKVLADPSIEARNAAARAVIAMAQHQSGNVSEARAALEKAADVVKNKLPALESGDIGDGWNDWIIAQLLMKEAKGLIEGSKPQAQ